MDKPINLLMYVDDNIKRKVIKDQIFNKKYKPNKDLLKINVGTIGHIDYNIYSTNFLSNQLIHYGHGMYRKKFPFQKYYIQEEKLNLDIFSDMGFKNMCVLEGVRFGQLNLK